MGSMFRSDPMVLCELFIPPTVAYSTISGLGEVGCVQFRDLNVGVSEFQRAFVIEINRCDDVERQIQFIKDELKKHKIPLPQINYDDVEMPRALDSRKLLSIEARLDLAEDEIVQLNENEGKLKDELFKLTSMRQVLESAEVFFPSELDLENLLDLFFLSGIVEKKRMHAFEKMLWRISHGNVLFKHVAIQTESKDPRVAFIVFFQGEQLKKRISKVCTGFHAIMCPCPGTYDERKKMLEDVIGELKDLTMVLLKTHDERHEVLEGISESIPSWSIMVKKRKAIYFILNHFKTVSPQCMVGECWIPKSDLPIFKKTIANFSLVVGSYAPSFFNVIDTKEKAPTYFRVNKFTQAFQNLTDAYGIASYREVNPALYSIITFPFLFAVMFGDVGHGLIVFGLGAWMCIYEKRLSNIEDAGEIWSIMFGGRYVILLMGLFSLYTGLIYNDIFSKSVNIFGSGWKNNYQESTVIKNDYLHLDPKDSKVETYIIGIDPVWQLGQNGIIFYNSYKMKVSIIIGVIHMLFGLCLNVCNHIHFRHWANIITEFVPQVLFLIVMFGYLLFMMFFKWIKYSANSENFENTPGCAPAILVKFIDMMLFKDTPALAGCNQFMFDGQEMVQHTLIKIALVCIPWMLLSKPLFIFFQRKRKGKSQLADSEEPFGEILIHQSIHTIEYFLSTISHTASYLRLWALSLAHSQLSKVIWDRLLSPGLGVQSMTLGPILTCFNFLAFVFFTIAILVLMEALSAFLHTLRLHWVEFMSKHYDGNGYAFKPFSFKLLLRNENGI